MLSYLKKFAMDILPSVAATIIGAYIVNHYIVTKPGADAPVAAAVSAADPKAEGKAESNTGAKAATAADVGNMPAAGVKAKGISEKAIMEKTAAERPTVVEKAETKTEAKADAKSTEAPVETASLPPDTRRHPAAPREKIRVIPLVQSPAPAVAPVVTTPNPAPAVEAAVAPEERRDANDLARAAIERLRAPETTATARIPETRAPEAPRIATVPALRPLPPPIMVSAPSAADLTAQGSSQPRPPYAANAGVSDPGRPTPPADIPLSRPLDLRAEAAEPSVRERTTAVAEEVLSSAKSLFHAVLPK